ncbi:MAG: hypothetical protein ACAH21_09030 [Ramlibacter sp.]
MFAQVSKSDVGQARLFQGIALSAFLVAALHLAAGSARAGPATSAPGVGQEFEIDKRYETSQQASDGPSGSSRGRDRFLERVIGVRDSGLELEFDLPKDATSKDRVRNWQFPVRVFRPLSGQMQLLNGPELEARLGSWLKAAGLTREACGKWIFTWNAFRIECDPESVVGIVEALDLRAVDLREGVSYREPEARLPGTLTRKSAGPNGTTYAVAMEIDPDAIRRARAEADVAAGEMLQKPVTLDAALRERAKESVSGTISVVFDTDPDGNVRRRTKVTKVETKGPAGRSESQTVMEVVERRPLQRQAQ